MNTDKPESTTENRAGKIPLERLVRRIFLYEVVRLCAKEAEFVKCFDRLTDSNLSLNGTGLELMIDEVTGKQNDDIKKFIDFVDEFVFQRLPPLDKNEVNNE